MTTQQTTPAARPLPAASPSPATCDCDYCAGNGYLICTNCSGNGARYPERYRAAICQACRGRGTIGCSVCEGSGRVEVAAEGEEGEE